MYKNHKKALILSSLLTLFPIVIGLLLWNKLPDVMATHWGADNQPDGYSSKAFAVFVFPFILLGIHWLCLWITSLDPGHKKQSEKATKMTFWLIPIASLFVTSIMYGLALGNKINMGSVLFGMMGLMFMGIGNYMPKACVQKPMVLSRGERDLGVAFQTHPGRQASISSGSKELRSAIFE